MPFPLYAYPLFLIIFIGSVLLLYLYVRRPHLRRNSRTGQGGTFLALLMGMSGSFLISPFFGWVGMNNTQVTQATILLMIILFGWLDILIRGRNRWL